MKQGVHLRQHQRPGLRGGQQRGQVVGAEAVDDDDVELAGIAEGFGIGQRRFHLHLLQVAAKTAGRQQDIAVFSHEQAARVGVGVQQLPGQHAKDGGAAAGQEVEIGVVVAFGRRRARIQPGHDDQPGLLADELSNQLIYFGQQRKVGEAEHGGSIGEKLRITNYELRMDR